jgi:hypothetical protein
MTLTVAQWPFLPAEQRTPEQEERWWTECYLPSPADVTLRGVTRSVIVAGQSGSGKSIALQALEKQEAERWLIFRYPTERWPGEAYAWAGGRQHLGQMMACAAVTIKEFLTRQPDRVGALSETKLEFLRWLIEKYSTARAFRRWADDLNQPALLKLAAQPFEDIYPSDTVLSDVQGQIEELVMLSRRFGLAGVMALVDVHEGEISGEAMLEKMANLFGWLTPLQFEGFAIKAALPESAVEKARLVERSRGRISFVSLRWSIEACREISQRHLQAATDNELQTLFELVSEELLTTLESQIIAAHGSPQPQAWLRLTFTLLKAHLEYGEPLSLAHHKGVIHTYFANYVPLKFDRLRRGVWRGVEFIPLDEQPFSFIEVLWQYRGGQYANEALLHKVASTQANLNTLANRLRKKIEPAPDAPVYLLNTRSQGYMLENVIEASPG